MSSTSMQSEYEVFDNVQSCSPTDDQQLAVTTPTTPNFSHSLTKSRLSVQSDQAVCDILRDYYSPSNKNVEDISAKKTHAKPIISKALLPRSLRSSESSQTVSVSTSGVDYAVPLCLLKGAQAQDQPIMSCDKSSAKELLSTTPNEKISKTEVNSQWPNQNAGTPVLFKYDTVKPDVTETAIESSSQDTPSDVLGVAVDDHGVGAAVPDTARLEIASSRAFFKSLITDTKFRSSDAQRADDQPLNPKHRTSSQTSNDSNDSLFVEHGDTQLTTTNNDQNSGVKAMSASVKSEKSEDIASKTSLESNDEVPKMADSKAFFESIQKNTSVVNMNNRSQVVARSSTSSTSKQQAPTKRHPVSELPVVLTNCDHDETSELPSMADSKAFFENLRKQQQHQSPVSTKPKVVIATRTGSDSSTGQATMQSKLETDTYSNGVSRSTSQVDVGDTVNLTELSTGEPVAKIGTPVICNSMELSTGGLVPKVSTPLARTSWTSLQWKPTMSKTITETSSSSVSESPELTSTVTGTKAFFESKSTTSPSSSAVKSVKRGASMSAADSGARFGVGTAKQQSSSAQLAATIEDTVFSAPHDTCLTPTAAKGQIPGIIIGFRFLMQAILQFCKMFHIHFIKIKTSYT